MWSEEETVLISAIEHYSYCPRQCGLIHVEQVFDENVFTLRGSRAHERADTVTWEMRDSTRIERALPLWSFDRGLNGRADTVEFLDWASRGGWDEPLGGGYVPVDGSIVPVEYKHGPRRQHRHDDLQLCAQALCLEEMFHVEVPTGAIYHHTTKRRRDVLLTSDLRSETVEVIAQVREMQREGRLPPPVNDARCPNCSLVDACAPAALVAGRLAYYARQIYVLTPEILEEIA